MKIDEIRTSFLEFFRTRDHVLERSDKLVPSNDPSLLFTSAGMVQFKPFYTGEVPVPYRRATTSQKCLRAGGKANDLDEVGKTNRHMTFFEMLGNFSFGDYFKREAIAWAWEYSTEVVKLPSEKIWVSVFEDDDEAAEIWAKEIGLDERKIVRLGVKDNFWGPAGDTGACGPCSELHIDRGEALGCGRPECGPGCDACERFLEFWNLVFPQFDQQPDGSRPQLKNRGIDTGMGLERLAALLQDQPTVFDVDGIKPIILATESMAKTTYDKNPAPFRVIADHIRSLSFLIADGILPGNEGRGYVERRLLRRAARFGREIGLERPFLHELSHTVVDLMSQQYPELSEKRRQIDKVIHTEEERFSSTLARGMDLLDEVFSGLTSKGDTVVSGEALFKLHDTYGFPLDLATDMAEDRGFQVDKKGFDSAMSRQREQARSAWSGSGAQEIPKIYSLLYEELKDTVFTGYVEIEDTARILAIIKNGQRVEKLTEGEEGEVVLNQTPFYAESGGQIGDTGNMDSVQGSARVTDTRSRVGKMILHRVKVNRGVFCQDDVIQTNIDDDRRHAIMGHHTATHLLQAALRDILGDHVHQAGSLVAPDRLRFDFTHFESIGSGRLQDIERKVNQFIRQDVPVCIENMSLSDARAAGAMALFGEKYGDIVRVVKAGDVSMELCGGTHVPRTGVIGCFKIVSESSVAAGVRRIEAVCGETCIEYIQTREHELTRTAHLLNSPPEELSNRVQSLLDENKRLQREAQKLKQAAATGASVDYLSKVLDVKGVKLLATEVDNQDAAGLRALMDTLRDKLGSGVIVLGSASEGKASLCVAVSKDLTAKVKAGDIVKELAPIVDGGGGGRPDMAQAGGKTPENLPQVIQRAPEVLEALMG